MSSERPTSHPAALPLLVGVAVVIVFVAFMLRATDGHFVPQIVDLYVVLQYARAFAEGHPFQYNAGEAASTGSTSLLFTLLLAVGHAVGIRGEALVGLAILIGTYLVVNAVYHYVVPLDEMRSLAEDKDVPVLVIERIFGGGKRAAPAAAE